jgi:hypothetical protein
MAGQQAAIPAGSPNSVVVRRALRRGVANRLPEVVLLVARPKAVVRRRPVAAVPEERPKAAGRIQEADRKEVVGSRWAAGIPEADQTAAAGSPPAAESPEEGRMAEVRTEEDPAGTAEEMAEVVPTAEAQAVRPVADTKAAAAAPRSGVAAAGIPEADIPVVGKTADTPAGNSLSEGTGNTPVVGTECIGAAAHTRKAAEAAAGSNGSSSSPERTEAAEARRVRIAEAVHTEHNKVPVLCNKQDRWK